MNKEKMAGIKSFVFIFSNSNVITETANLPHMMNKNVKMT